MLRRRAKGALTSVGVDTWGSDFALLDRHGVLVANPWHYRDERTSGMQELVEQTVPRAELYAQTGNQSMRQNTLLQLMAMVRQGSPLLDSAHTLLMIPDLFHYWMTGARSVEFSSATTTQFYNPRAGRWATELLASLGLPARLLPPIVAPGTRLGSLAPWVQELCACGPLDVVLPVTHDTGSAVVAAPVVEPGFAFISSGTWSLVGTEVPAPVIDPKGLALNITNEGGWNGTYRYLKNVLGLWLVQECRRTYARRAGSIPTKNSPRWRGRRRRCAVSSIPTTAPSLRLAICRHASPPTAGAPASPYRTGWAPLCAAFWKAWRSSTAM